MTTRWVVYTGDRQGPKSIRSLIEVRLIRPFLRLFYMAEPARTNSLLQQIRFNVIEYWRGREDSNFRGDVENQPISADSRRTRQRCTAIVSCKLPLPFCYGHRSTTPARPHCHSMQLKTFKLKNSFVGGRGRIRTFEGRATGFTVQPVKPLRYTPNNE